MSDETDNLLKQIKDLSAEAKKYRLRAGEYKARVAKAEDDAAKARDEIAQARSEAASPSDAQREIEALKAEIRGSKHRDVFNEEARKAGVSPEAFNDLWSISGYKSETDVPDPKDAASVVAEALKSRPWLTTPATDAAKAGTQPGPGATRGAIQTLPGRFTVTMANMRDPVWMRANQTEMAKHQKAGTLVMQD